MSSAARKDCIFRQMAENPEAMPTSVANVFGAFTENEPETPVKTAEMLTVMDAPICNVKDCKLSNQGLIRYITSAGDDAPRQELDEMVAPSCAILDVPHTAEEVLGPYMYPDDPRS